MVRHLVLGSGQDDIMPWPPLAKIILYEFVTLNMIQNMICQIGKHAYHAPENIPQNTDYAQNAGSVALATFFIF